MRTSDTHKYLYFFSLYFNFAFLSYPTDNNITNGLSNAALIMLENKHPFSRILLLIWTGPYASSFCLIGKILSVRVFSSQQTSLPVFVDERVYVLAKRCHHVLPASKLRTLLLMNKLISGSLKQSPSLVASHPMSCPRSLISNTHLPPSPRSTCVRRGFSCSENYLFCSLFPYSSTPQFSLPSLPSATLPSSLLFSCSYQYHLSSSSYYPTEV